MFRLLIHLNLNFPEKGLGLVSPSNFVDNFSRKMIFMLYSSNWPNFIAWLPLLFEILGNMFTVVFIWKLLWVLKKCFCYIYTLLLSCKIKSFVITVFPSKSDHTPLFCCLYYIVYIIIIYILQDCSSVRIVLKMDNKCHTLSVVYTISLNMLSFNHFCFTQS